MEDNRSLFSLAIDPVTKSNLADIARWTRIFVIGSILALVAVVALGIYQAFMLDSYAGLDEPLRGSMEAGKIFLVVFYVIILLIAALPIWYLLKFSSNMNKALAASDQENFNEAFSYLKSYFRFIAVLTLISFVLIGISFAVSIIGINMIQ